MKTYINDLGDDMKIKGLSSKLGYTEWGKWKSGHYFLHIGIWRFSLCFTTNLGDGIYRLGLETDIQAWPNWIDLTAHLICFNIELSIRLKEINIDY